ncbi:hypothetical protein [Flavobacterium taihuense]|nr:hypothetical protein [Flavobacterium taihuense]
MIRIRVTKLQFKMLIDNFEVLAEKGLILKMDAPTYLFVYGE